MIIDLFVIDQFRKIIISLKSFEEQIYLVKNIVAPGLSASFLPFLTNISTSSVQQSLLSVLNKTAAKTSYIANKLDDTLEGINLEQHLADISQSSLAMVTSMVDSNPR